MSTSQKIRHVIAFVLVLGGLLAHDISVDPQLVSMLHVSTGFLVGVGALLAAMNQALGGGGNADRRGFARAGLLAGVAVAGLLALGAATLPGCSWFQNGGETQVANAAGQAAACVMTQVEQGQTDPGAIVAACAGVTLDDVISIVESLIAFELSGPVDAGTQVAKMQRLQSLLASAHAKAGH